ncbi:hypothetical protein ASF61_17515 [Duganella sp. Leaf126]|uniref:Sec-independent protein translocase subunit TatA n=1 Tax=Duganella sp. Leaf126 TaxID=1736266 RepID=UPI0006FB75D5|nr:Sec-independent protein translocase subunit TatA [Duganella sp. Leaf126]KQQ31027.1 hypothetical protein ASF61_17515 [Duganella sp. Leaf126]
MGSMSWIHWAIVLVVVILIFGTKKLGNMGSDIGKAVKGFKDGVKGSDEDKPVTPPAPPAPPVNPVTPSTIDVDVKEKNKL